MVTDILTEHPARIISVLSSIQWVEPYEDEDNKGTWNIRYEGKTYEEKLGELAPYEFTEARGADGTDGVDEGDIGSKIRYSGYRSVEESDIQEAIKEYKV